MHLQEKSLTIIIIIIIIIIIVYCFCMFNQFVLFQSKLSQSVGVQLLENVNASSGKVLACQCIFRKSPCILVLYFYYVFSNIKASKVLNKNRKSKRFLQLTRLVKRFNGLSVETVLNGTYCFLMIVFPRDGLVLKTR